MPAGRHRELRVYRKVEHGYHNDVGNVALGFWYDTADLCVDARGVNPLGGARGACAYEQDSPARASCAHLHLRYARHTADVADVRYLFCAVLRFWYPLNAGFQVVRVHRRFYHQLRCVFCRDLPFGHSVHSARPVRSG